MAVKQSQALKQTLHFRASCARLAPQSRLSVCEHRSDEGVHELPGSDQNRDNG